MTTSEINALEKRYFDFLINLFEIRGTTFTKNLLSQYAIRDTWNNYTGDMSFIQRGLESVIKGVVFEAVDWEICSTPEGSDSVFQTSRAMIHIDAKAYKYSDTDAIHNKLNMGPNQTSYFTNERLMYQNKPFTSNLPTFYNHRAFGQIPCLSYFLKLIYNLDEELDTFRTFKLILCSVPNGELVEELGTGYFQAGKTSQSTYRTSIRINYSLLQIDEQNEFKWKRFHELNMI